MDEQSAFQKINYERKRDQAANNLDARIASQGLRACFKHGYDEGFQEGQLFSLNASVAAAIILPSKEDNLTRKLQIAEDALYHLGSLVLAPNRRGHFSRNAASKALSVVFDAIGGIKLIDDPKAPFPAYNFKNAKQGAEECIP